MFVCFTFVSSVKKLDLIKAACFIIITLWYYKGGAESQCDQKIE